MPYFVRSRGFIARLSAVGDGALKHALQTWIARIRAESDASGIPKLECDIVKLRTLAIREL